LTAQPEYFATRTGGKIDWACAKLLGFSAGEEDMRASTWLI
jgi:hypothetical protein